MGDTRSTSPLLAWAEVHPQRPSEPKLICVNVVEVWYGIPEFDILAPNITITGLSPLFPDVHCTADGDIYQVVTGESEINAATTISALVFSSYPDLTSTYLMVGGIADVNSEVATTVSVTLAKYAVQVALQYELDARENPDNFSTGYVPRGGYSPTDYPIE